MSLNEFRGSQEFEEVQKLNQAIRDGIESTGIPNGMATQGGVTTQAAIDAGIAARKEAAAEREERKKSQIASYKNPLRKIGGGGVLQYPIDLDTDIQDYFEIQIFRYRPAQSLPSLTNNNQGYSYDSQGNPTNTTKNFRGETVPIYGTYYAGSNRRGNRQNFRLQDLQSTIQLPIPPSIKDMNSVDFYGGTMSGAAAAAFSPVINNLLGQRGTDPSDLENATGGNVFQQLRRKAGNIFNSTGKVSNELIREVRDALDNKGFKRVTSAQAIAQAIGALGVNIDVDQAITRSSGAVRNPNLELLFKGPALRNFSFTIRLTPRNTDESKRIRMIVRALKQHSAVKRNPQLFSGTNDIGSNFLLGTPDVFKLRYIKARTQKDIKGLNKFKTCALNSISVDYTGEVGRFAAYEEDSQPITTVMSLSFTELAPIYDADYAEFTTDDDVGL
tara:strand:+ start:353 stop:1684 length:1332 start_codon:yes stop_codon:yes gene_type:complete